MLRLHTNKKRILPILIGIMVFLPAIPIIANNLSSNDTSAIDYPMPAGFTDQNFYNCVVGEFKSEYPNEEIPASGLTDEQLGKIEYLYCNGSNKEASQKIQNTDGLEKMTALASLNLGLNQLTSIDVSHNTALTELGLHNNQLTTLDVPHNTSLTRPDLPSNQLTSIDVSNNTALTYLDLNHNQLTTLDVSHNTALKQLDLGDNQLTSIDVSNNTVLKDLRLYSNQLTSIDVPHNTALTYLDLNHNQLTSIDVSHNTALTGLRLGDNQLTTLDVSHNTALTDLWLFGNQLTSIDISNNTSVYVLSVDADILVKTWISRIEGSETEEFNLSSLKFFREIIAGEGYSFNSESKILSFDSPRSISYVPVRLPGGTTIRLELPYYLTFDTNGGVGDIANQYCNTVGDCTLSIPSTKPERDGYFFLGWADSSDATTATYQPNSSITISENKTLFAIWAPIYTLSINPNNGTGTVEPQSCTATDESCNVTIPNDINLSRSGYTLLGFADSASATTATYTKGQNVSLSADKTIYAVWEVKSTPDPDPTPDDPTPDDPTPDDPTPDDPTPDPDPTPTPTPTPAQEDNVKVPDTGMFSSENGNAFAIFSITTFVILSAITAAAIHKKHASGHFKYDE